MAPKLFLLAQKRGIMWFRHWFAGAILVGSLSGCGISASSTAVANGTPQSTPGERRLVDATADPADCLQTCGLEARRGSYAECLEQGGEAKECGVQARVWYRGCLERECSTADIQLDDCRHTCRVTGAAEREDCTAQASAAETCQSNAIDRQRGCLSECDGAVPATP